ncbi:MAG TPA: OsmC family protein [Ottowia sp.]|nr:OsmC family protein [Ottowia sp.]
MIATWAGRYLEPAPEAPAADDGWVQVQETGTGAYAVDVQAGRHHWLADEPVAVGGDDAGPNPYQMLSAALGACTVMTMRMYANRKQWPLERARVALRHEKVHASDCAECETRTGRIDRIERRIEVEGALDAAQRQRLLEIADMCPVHRTLHAEVQVVSELVDPERGR